MRFFCTESGLYISMQPAYTAIYFLLSVSHIACRLNFVIYNWECQFEGCAKLRSQAVPTVLGKSDKLLQFLPLTDLGDTFACVCVFCLVKVSAREGERWMEAMDQYSQYT